MKKILFCATCISCLLLVSCVSSKDTSKSHDEISQTTKAVSKETVAPTVQTATPEPQTATPEPTKKTDELSLESYTAYDEGNYKVGTDIPEGEYFVTVTSEFGGYYCVSSDPNKEKITFNDNFMKAAIITIKNNEYLELNGCKAIKYSDVLDYYQKAKKEFKKDVSGMTYKVGDMLPAGEYKVIADGDDGEGYYCIYKNSRNHDIISNNMFKKSAYVKVKKGQYLKLSNCHLEDKK